MTVALKLDLLPNDAGWQASLSLRFEHRPAQARTVPVHISHTGPLRVQRPFHPEGDVCHVYILHPPGGVVGGDGLQIDARCAPDARALLTTPGATKFYRSAGATARVRQQLYVQAQASLEWLPQENIFFPGAQVDMGTDIHLSSSAQLVAWEINCLGRPVIGERFDEGKLRTRLRVFVDGQPLLIENQRISCTRHLSAAAGLRDAAVQGVLVAWRVDEQLAQDVQQHLADTPEILAGATLIDGLLVVRALANNAERLRALLADVWQLLRVQLISRPAVLPRIWAT
ncbi:MAG: urease accessory protein UreD [Gammaproteobacteria bacterium]|nr:urease accessory protein UreD [Gammaproteobacteria bacterium]MBQ0774475.1 urease accessory protein UreD [Gammaproteobacteria bacterium]